jgi:phosphoribosyl 1,2-cyclic phosphodiesterase
MSLYLASLNSGSNGNCYYIANEDEAVFIDVGISCREVEKRMKRMGLAISKVKAIFVSHEHGDHIHGVPALSKKHKIPTYITPQTHRESRLALTDELVFSFKAYEPIQIGKLRITAFPKFHDAIDPHSFVVSHEGVNVGVFTDIGVACEHVTKNFAHCHAVFLEANYDEEMLETGVYPLHLKNRIRNGRGHLSNRQAADLFQNHRAPFLSHLFLSHLSRNNNTQQCALHAFAQAAHAVNVSIAPRDKETTIYYLQRVDKDNIKGTRSSTKRIQIQLSLFQ